MATEVVNLKITVDSSGAVNSVNKLKTNLGGVNKSFGNTGTAGALAFSRVKGAIAGLGLGLLIKEVAQTSAEFEDLQLALNAVFGGVEEGAAAFDRVKDIAGKLPLDIDLITSAFTQLKGAGIEPTEELLLSFSDAASVSTDKVGAFQSSIDLFTRTMQGGLGLEELQRLQDRGLPVFDVLNEKLGITRLEVSNLGKTAEGAKQIRDALFQGFDERFGGATEIALTSLSTRFSNFGDAMKKAAVAFGGKGQGGFLDGLAEATGGLTDFIGENEDLIAAMGRLLGQGLNLVIDAFGLLFDAIRVVVDIVTSTVDAFISMKNTLVEVANGVIEFKNKVTGKFTEMKNEAVDSAKSLYEGVTGFFSKTEEEVVGGSIVPDMVDGVLREFHRMERETISSTRSMSEGTTNIMRTEFSDSNLQHILVDPVDRATTSVSGSFNKMENSISNNIAGVLKGTKSFKDALIDLGSQAITGGLGNIISGGGIGGGGGGLGGIISSVAGSFFGGLFANGGKLAKNKFGIVGEKGPEIITGPATITPLSKDRGGVSPVFNFNITGNLGTQTSGTVTQTDLNRMAGRVLEESIKIMSTQGRFA
tara:strand:+ start:235 stop:2004 length:1770 start_codon:yes stop_codon:yes gene_type:complete